MDIYCVSLAQSLDRRQSFSSQALRENITFKFWDGFFPGSDIEHRLMKRGQLGCYMAHLSLWQHLLANEVEYAMVFEDDVQIVPHFWDKFDAIVRSHFQELLPDFLYLGYSEFGDFYKTMHRYRRVNDDLIIPGYPCGTFAYWVNSQALRLIYDNLKIPRSPVDNAMYDNALISLNTYACSPKLVLPGNFHSLVQNL